MQSFRSDGRSEPIPRGGSVSPLEKYTQRIFALIGEQPDLTLNEMVCALRKRITVKKPTGSRARAGRRGPGAAALDTRARMFDPAR
jgi:hypothetical protein